MKKHLFLAFVIAFGLLSITVLVPVYEVAEVQGQTASDFVPATVFQAAGPNRDSILGTVDEFRAALGEPDNLNNPGPLASGRREINWDGGGANTCWARTERNRWCIPVTGSHTDIAAKVSPW